MKNDVHNLSSIGPATQIGKTNSKSSFEAEADAASSSASAGSACTTHETVSQSTKHHKTLEENM